MGLNPWQIAGISGGAVGLTGIIAALVTMRLELFEPDGESAPPPPVQAIKSAPQPLRETVNDRRPETKAKNKRLFNEPVTFEEPLDEPVTFEEPLDEPPRLANAQKGLLKEEELHRERRKESWERQKALDNSGIEVPYHERRKQRNRRTLTANIRPVVPPKPTKPTPPIPPIPPHEDDDEDDDDFEAVFDSLPYELRARLQYAVNSGDEDLYAALVKEALGMGESPEDEEHRLRHERNTAVRKAGDGAGFMRTADTDETFEDRVQRMAKTIKV